MMEIQTSQAELSWRLPPTWLAFTVPEGNMEAAREEQASTILLCCELLQYQPDRQDIHTCATVTQLSWIEVINHSLTGFEAHSTGGNPCL